MSTHMGSQNVARVSPDRVRRVLGVGLCVAAGVTTLLVAVPVRFSQAVVAGPVTLFTSSTPGSTATAATIPANVCFVTISAEGGRGGAAYEVPNTPVPGGAGAKVVARVPVAASASMNVVVGGGGAASVSLGSGPGGTSARGGNGGFGGGGQGGLDSGGGGGASVVTSSAGTPVVVAGGGGGRWVLSEARDPAGHAAGIHGDGGSGGQPSGGDGTTTFMNNFGSGGPGHGGDANGNGGAPFKYLGQPFGGGGGGVGAGGSGIGPGGSGSANVGGGGGAGGLSDGQPPSFDNTPGGAGGSGSGLGGQGGPANAGTGGAGVAPGGAGGSGGGHPNGDNGGGGGGGGIGFGGGGGGSALGGGGGGGYGGGAGGLFGGGGGGSSFVAASAVSTSYSAGALTGDGRVTISYDPATDLCLPLLSIADVSVQEGDASTVTASFTVSLSAAAPIGGVTFDVATADGSAKAPADYVAKSLTEQSIPFGTSSYTFTVLVNGDTAVEPDETFAVNVTNVVNAIVDDGKATGTITNDDTDTTNPAVVLVTPSIGEVVPSVPVVISGSATDDVGVMSVGVAVYRDVAGGQYWNGASWQAANTTVGATLTNPGAKSTVWTYSFAGPPGGVFAAAAVALDAAGNSGVAPYRLFSVSDTVVPTVAVSHPLPGEVLAGRPIVVDGTVSDNADVHSVRLALYRPVGDGQFWNGSTWQAAYTTVNATLSPPVAYAAVPGDTNATWSYSFAPPQAGGLFYVSAIGIDTSYNYSATPYQSFSLPDAVPPAAAISTPVNGANVSGPFTVSGSATDDNAIGRMGVVVFEVSTGKFWNGTSFQAGFSYASVALATPGDTSSTWTTTVNPPTPGDYLVGALPIDGSFNYTLTSFITIHNSAPA